MAFLSGVRPACTTGRRGETYNLTTVRHTVSVRTHPLFAPVQRMKLQPDRPDVQTITGYGDGWVTVDQDRVEGSVIVGAHGLREPWHCERFEDLTPGHFARLAELGAEVVIFGSGRRNRFPPPAWLRPLIGQRIGLETMDTAAACRTYNILAAEGRDVVVAMLLEAPLSGL